MVAACDFGYCEVLSDVYTRLEQRSQIESSTANQLQSRLEKVKSLGGAFASIEFSEEISSLF